MPAKVFVLAAIVAFVAGNGTWFVGPGATSVPDGSLAAPFPVLEAAIGTAIANAGGEVVVLFTGATAAVYQIASLTVPVAVSVDLGGNSLQIQQTVMVLASLTVRNGGVSGAAGQSNTVTVPVSPLGTGRLELRNVTITNTLSPFVVLAGGSLLIANCTYVGNFLPMAVVASGGTVSVVDTVYEKNAQTMIALLAAGTVSIANSTVRDNKVDSGLIAAMAAGTDCRITNTKFVNNNVTMVLIALMSGSLYMESTLFRANVVTSGPLFVSNKTETKVQSSEFTMNAVKEGVIVAISGSAGISISSCRFTQNIVSNPLSAVVAISPQDGTLTAKLHVDNSLFSMNSPMAIASAGPETEVILCNFTMEVACLGGSSVSLMNVSGSAFVGVGVGVMGKDISALEVTGSTFMYCNASVQVLGKDTSSSGKIADSRFVSNFNTMDTSPSVTIVSFLLLTVSGSLFSGSLSSAPASLYLVQCQKVILSRLRIVDTVSPSAGAISLVSSNAYLIDSLISRIASLSPISLGYASQIYITASTLEHIDAGDSNIITGEVNTLVSNYSTYRNLTCLKELFQVHSFISNIEFDHCVFEDVLSKSLLDEEPVQVIFTNCVLNFTSRSKDMVMIYTTISDFRLKDSLVTGSLRLVLDVYSTGFVNVYFSNVTFRDLQVDGFIMSISTSIDISNCTFANVTIANFHRYFMLLSPVALMNSTFKDVDGGILSLLRSTVTVWNCSFTELTCTGMASLLSSTNSTVNFTNVSIDNFVGEKRGALMDIEQDSTFLADNLHIRSIARCFISCIIVSSATFRLSRTEISSIPSNFISAVDSVVVLSDTTARGTVQLDVYRNGGLLECLECLQLRISNCVFQDLMGSSGGVVYVANTNPKKLISETPTQSFLLSIEDTTFVRTNATEAGGCLYISEGNLYAQSLSFLNSTADKGGAVALLCTPTATSYRCDYFFNRTEFAGNRAAEGGAVHYNVLLPRLDKSTVFDGNSAVFGPDMAGVPAFLRIASETTWDTFRVISGARLNETLVFGVYDSLGQLVTSHMDNTCRVAVQVPGVTIQGNTIAPVSSGVCVFDALTIISNPGNSFNLSISSTAIDYDLPEPNSNQRLFPINLGVLMINCSVGSVLSGGICQKCPTGQYSFNPQDSVCSVCGKGMKCKGGEDVVIEQGFWRSHNLTDKVYKCAIAENCLGGEGTGTCAAGNTDKLCGVCDKGWVRNGQFSCSICANKTQALVIVILGVTGLLVFLLLLVYTSIKYAKRNAKTTAVLLRILMNFIQEVVILRNLDLKWPDGITSLFSGLKKVWAVDYTFTSYSCSYSSGSSHEDSTFINQQIVCFGPVILMVICAVVWGLVAAIKRQTRFLKCHMVATFIILHATILMQIFTTNLSMLSCMDIEGRKWLLTDMRVECWTGTHLQVALQYTIPSLLLWCIALPVALLIFTVRSRRDSSEDTLVRYAFMCKGYKRYLFFWQFIIIFKKYLILLFIFLLSPESPTLTAVAMVYCFLLYIFAQMYYKPYLTSSLNFMEVAAVGFSISVLVTGLSGNNVDKKLSFVSYILMGLTFVVLATFVCYLTIQVLRTVCNWKRISGMRTIRSKKGSTAVRPSDSTGTPMA